MELVTPKIFFNEFRHRNSKRQLVHGSRHSLILYFTRQHIFKTDSMTIQEFKELDHTQQIMKFFGGVEIGKFEKDGILTECKQVDDFYVEYKIKLADHFQLSMECHRDTSLLDKYFGSRRNFKAEDFM